MNKKYYLCFSFVALVAIVVLLIRWSYVPRSYRPKLEEIGKTEITIYSDLDVYLYVISMEIPSKIIHKDSGYCKSDSVKVFDIKHGTEYILIKSEHNLDGIIEDICNANYKNTSDYASFIYDYTRKHKYYNVNLVVIGNRLWM